MHFNYITLILVLFLILPKILIYIFRLPRVERHTYETLVSQIAYAFTLICMVFMTSFYYKWMFVVWGLLILLLLILYYVFMLQFFMTKDLKTYYHHKFFKMPIVYLEVGMLLVTGILTINPFILFGAMIYAFTHIHISKTIQEAVLLNKPGNKKKKTKK